VTVGRRPEPITVYAETPPRRLRWLGKFDATPTPGVQEFDVWLLPGETIRPDAARLFAPGPAPAAAESARGKRRPARRRLPLARGRRPDL